MTVAKMPTEAVSHGMNAISRLVIADEDAYKDLEAKPRVLAGDLVIAKPWRAGRSLQPVGERCCHLRHSFVQIVGLFLLLQA